MSCRFRIAGCLVWLVAIVAGCSEERPEFAPVDGVVRINNKPADRLLVRFSPDPERGNKFPAVASGTSDAQGKFVLKYEFRGEEGVGAPIGWHRVTVIDTKVGHTPQGRPPKPSSVPSVYANTSTTPLVVEVKADVPTIEINVKK